MSARQIAVEVLMVYATFAALWLGAALLEWVRFQ